ncbi:hypothetical protein CHCC15291_2562 [Bacillus licheniformis]|nr:hypothetical protein CHCC15291_2562 [Bacillus licheniformis]
MKESPVFISLLNRQIKFGEQIAARKELTALRKGLRTTL